MARRVLFFTTALGGGGAERHAVRVLNHLDRERYTPSVAVTRRGGSYERLLAPDIPLHGVSFDAIPSSLARVMVGGGGLRRLVSRLRPDVVCSVMDVPNLAALAGLAGLQQRPKLALCVQIPPTLMYPSSALGRLLLLPAMRRYYPAADRIIALSRGVADDLAHLRPELREITRVIYNACVDDTDEPEDPGADPLPSTSVPVVLAAGRLAEQKGFVYLLDAWPEVVRTNQAELSILGEGPLRADLEAQIRRLGIGSSVRLLGFRSNPERYMRRAALFVLSSIFEGFGNVIAEALSCGTPVVSTDCPYGPSEILTDGKTGLLVPVRDSAALASAISRVLGNPGLRHALSENGRERAAFFGARRVASEYADEFDALCGG